MRRKKSRAELIQIGDAASEGFVPSDGQPIFADDVSGTLDVLNNAHRAKAGADDGQAAGQNETEHHAATSSSSLRLSFTVDPHGHVVTVDELGHPIALEATGPPAEVAIKAAALLANVTAFASPAVVQSKSLAEPWKLDQLLSVRLATTDDDGGVLFLLLAACIVITIGAYIYYNQAARQQVSTTWADVRHRSSNVMTSLDRFRSPQPAQADEEAAAATRPKGSAKIPGAPYRKSLTSKSLGGSNTPVQVAGTAAVVGASASSSNRPSRTFPPPSQASSSNVIQPKKVSLKESADVAAVQDSHDNVRIVKASADAPKRRKESRRSLSSLSTSVEIAGDAQPKERVQSFTMMVDSDDEIAAASTGPPIPSNRKSSLEGRFDALSAPPVFDYERGQSFSMMVDSDDEKAAASTGQPISSDRKSSLEGRFDALHNQIFPERRVSLEDAQEPTALLKSGVQAGATKLEVPDPTQFAIGDTITIGNEQNVIIGFGSLLLKFPIRNAWPPGTAIWKTKKESANNVEDVDQSETGSATKIDSPMPEEEQKKAVEKVPTSSGMKLEEGKEVKLEEGKKPDVASEQEVQASAKTKAEQAKDRIAALAAKRLASASSDGNEAATQKRNQMAETLRKLKAQDAGSHASIGLAAAMRERIKRSKETAETKAQMETDDLLQPKQGASQVAPSSNQASADGTSNAAEADSSGNAAEAPETSSVKQEMTEEERLREEFLKAEAEEKARIKRENVQRAEFEAANKEEKAARDEAEKEAAETAARQAEKEVAEKAAREATEKEAAEKTANEAAEKEAAEKATREAAEKEAADEIAREAAEKEAAEKATSDTEKDAAEKAAGEAVEQEAADEVTREAAEKEAAEKATREAAEENAAEKAAGEAVEQEAAEKAAREAAEKEAAEKTASEANENEAARRPSDASEPADNF